MVSGVVTALIAKPIALALAGVISLGGSVAIAHAATVNQTAQRGITVGVHETCDMAVVNALSTRHPEVNQFIVMATESWTSTTGTVEVAARQSARDKWQCQKGPRVAMFGRSGTRVLTDRRTGDGTTPAGVFPLGKVTAWDGQQFSMFGNRADPGVQAPYRSVRNGDCWGAIPGDANYGKLVNKPNCPGPDDEWLPRFADVYSHAAVIGANLNPISGDEPGEPAYASAIFLHRHAYTVAGTTQGSPKTTSGCVSLDSSSLVETLRLIDPSLTPHFAIGPRSYLSSTA